MFIVILIFHNKRNISQIEDKNGKFNVGVSSIVRIQLKDGTHHEDIQYQKPSEKAIYFESNYMLDMEQQITKNPKLKH